MSLRATLWNVNRTRLRIAVSSSLLLVAAVVSACNNGADPEAAPANGSTAATPSAQVEDYPVEALPDPLPTPYLFRDEITIEETPVTETIYVVQPGDTLASIATRFCITLAEVQRLNNIVDVSALSIGQELRIPIREGGCGVAAPDSEDESSEDETTQLPGEVYTVQEGDSLSEIAARYGYTWRDLMSYNGLSEAQAGNLQVGQTLIIPPPPEDNEQQSAESETAEPPG